MGKCRVLVVADEAAISMLIEDMLLDLGIEIVGPASRLDPAVQLAREAGLEAAILDINIGGVHSCPVADVLHSRGPDDLRHGLWLIGFARALQVLPNPTQAFRPASVEPDPAHSAGREPM